MILNSDGLNRSTLAYYDVDTPVSVDEDLDESHEGGGLAAL